MRVLDAKVIKIWTKPKPAKAGEKKENPFLVEVGTDIRFDNLTDGLHDGMEVYEPKGKGFVKVKAHGTKVFFSRIHGTYTVHLPCILDRVGTIERYHNGLPIILKRSKNDGGLKKNSKGLTEAEFIKEYGHCQALVQGVFAGMAQAQMDEAARKAA